MGQSGQRSTQTHSFSQVPTAEIPRASFNRSYGYKTTMDAGLLVPFFVDEALPGDTFNVRSSGFCRLATPIYPIMDNMQMDTHYFAVPNRILWDNWKKFMGEQTDPGDSVDYLVPKIENTSTNLIPGTLGDYLGLPMKHQLSGVSALFTRAYFKIFNEWFRDQNLTDSIPEYTDDGPDPEAGLFFAPQERAKTHDYFTSCLPWPQKGPDVSLPLGTAAPVLGIGPPNDDSTFDTENVLVRESDGNFRNFAFARHISGADLSPDLYIEGSSTPGDPQIRADLQNATAATINELREAFQIQKMYERDARGGTRYTEIIKSHFNVNSPDARQQRPEYLGGGTTPVNISPIHSTSDTLTDVQTGRNLAALSAVGTTSFSGHGFTKSFTEHCIIIGLVSVRADLTYQQGLNRMWSRQTKLDFYWPALSHLGEQEVLNKEIFHLNTETDDDVFGYQERYAEYRYRPSQITGKFRSDAPETLDAWHLAEDFLDTPTLSNSFIKYDIPLDRCIAVTDEPHFICDFYHKMTCARPMPLFGVPGNIDRF